MTRGEFVSMVYASATRNHGDFAWYARRSLGIQQPSGAENPPNIGSIVEVADAMRERYGGMLECMMQDHGVTYGL